MCACVLSSSVMTNCLRAHGLYPTRLLCPRDSFSRQEYWSGLPFLPPGFLTQGLNPWLLGLLHWQVRSLPPAPSGKTDASPILSQLKGVSCIIVLLNFFNKYICFWIQFPKMWNFLPRNTQLPQILFNADKMALSTTCCYCHHCPWRSLEREASV